MANLPPELRERTEPSYWYERANIPRKLWSTDWERFEGTGAEKAADVALDLVDDWVNRGGVTGISLFGNPGRGKTTLVSTMLCSMLEATIPRTLGGLIEGEVGGYFITLAEYHRLYLRLYELDRWARRSPDGGQGVYVEWEDNFILRRFIEEEVPHLVVDDVGNEHQTTSGAVQDEFHALIRGRHSRDLSTSITSNITMEKFAETYGEPQLSFLHESTRVVPVTGQDFRRKARR